MCQPLLAANSALFYKKVDKLRYSGQQDLITYFSGKSYFLENQEIRSLEFVYYFIKMIFPEILIFGNIFMGGLKALIA